ncbi:MAG: polysaccharide deacetylase [Candidatus Limnocylindrales bacterium]|jgi:peptidoglycan/xylan/chitin deacetylase (PgdA/CDA1 family)
MKPDQQSIAGPRLALTFDVDGFSNWIGSLGMVSPGPLSRGEFEHIGLRRVLALLNEYRVQATFFVPGSTAVAMPAAVSAIVENGHEIGHHGWVHEPLARLSREQEQSVLLRGLDALDKVLHVRPVGYRSPSWDNSPDTVRLLLAEGFEYDSSLMGNDVEPYWCREGDVASQEEGFRWGTPVPLVEMPVGWHLDDHPYFARVEAPGVFNPGLRAPSSVLEIWRGELDFLCDVAKTGVLVFTFHPQVIGRGHLLSVLRTFLEEASSRPSLRFTTCQHYVRAWRAGREPQLPRGV